MSPARRPQNHLTDTYQFGASEILILSAVPEHDLQAARWLAEEITDIQTAGNEIPQLIFRTLLDPASFLRELDEALLRAQAGARPMIHLDGHGTPEGLRFDAQTFTPWPEIVDRFRLINIATRNNLVVTSGACHSAWAYSNTSLEQPVPFFGLLAPSKAISAGEVKEGFRHFYRAFLTTRNFEDGVNAMVGHVQQKVMAVLFAPDFLEGVVRTFIVDHCMGKGRRTRLESLVSQAVAAGAPLAVARKTFRQELQKPQARDLKRKGDHFLMIDIFPENADRFPIDYVTLERKIRAAALAERR